MDDQEPGGDTNPNVSGPPPGSMANPPPPPSGYPPPPTAPPSGSFPPQPPQQPPVVIKQGAGCLKIGLIVVGVLLIFGVLAVACLAFAGNEVAKEIGKATGVAKASDYKLEPGACEVDEFGTISISGTIKNTSSKNQGFEIEYQFLDPSGTQISTNSDFTDAIDKGKSGRWRVGSLSSDVPKGSTCKLKDVSYHIFDAESGD